MKRLVTSLAILFCVLAINNKSFAQYQAIASGNFTASTTWKGGSIPPDTVKAGTVLIPNGITVNLDKHLYINSGVSVTINGTLNGSNSISFKDASFTMGIGSTVQVDSVHLDNSLGSFTINSSFSPNKLTFKSGDLLPQNISTALSVQHIFLEVGTHSAKMDVTIKQNGSITLRGGTINLSTGKTLTLSNSYNVIYEVQSQTTGTELAGAGLKDVTVDVGMGNEVKLGDNLNISNGNLNLTNGDLNLNNFNLEISGSADIPIMGSNAIRSSAVSSITVNKPSATNPLYLTFAPNANTIHTINVNTGSDIRLRNDLRVTDTVNFQSGKLNVQGNNLFLISGAVILNADNSKYIVTGAGGQGKLVSDVAPNTSVAFPIGTADIYAPCIITSKNNTPYNSFGASVDADVKNRGNMGSSISSTQPLVNATWFFDHQPSSNIALDVELMWTANAEVNNFDRNNCYISQMAGATWDKKEPAAATENNGMYSIKREDITYLSALAVFDQNTVDVDHIATKEQIKIYPNPATNVLNIDNAANAVASIYNTTGQMLIQQQINEAKSKINITQLPTGVYLIKLSSNGKMTTLRFSK